MTQIHIVKDAYYGHVMAVHIHKQCQAAKRSVNFLTSGLAMAVALTSAYRSVEPSYGHEVLNLVLAHGGLTKPLENQKVSKYIGQSQPEVLKQFAALVRTTALE